MRRTTTIRAETAALAAALLAAGCGGGARTAATPRLPGPLADRLAAQADGVATALDQGNACAARARGRALQIRTIREINARHVPGAYQDQLMSAVNEVMAQLPPCVATTTTPAAPAPATQTTTNGDEHGKKQQKQEARDKAERRERHGDGDGGGGGGGD